LLVVWLLTGIWHGASWNFLAWGMMYFVLLVLEKYMIHPEKFSGNSLRRYAWQAFSMLMVLLGWVLFRAEGMTNGIRYGFSMIGIGAPLSSNDAVFYSREYIVVFAAAILCSTPVFRRLKEYVEQTRWIWVADILKAMGYAVLLLFSVSYLVMGAHNPFIYFNF
jgi:alginate O-acetyltransferase complex protein AlgI